MCRSNAIDMWWDFTRAHQTVPTKAVDYCLIKQCGYHSHRVPLTRCSALPFSCHPLHLYPIYHWNSIHSMPFSTPNNLPQEQLQPLIPKGSVLPTIQTCLNDMQVVPGFPIHICLVMFFVIFIWKCGLWSKVLLFGLVTTGCENISFGPL